MERFFYVPLLLYESYNIYFFTLTDTSRMFYFVLYRHRRRKLGTGGTEEIKQKLLEKT